MPNAGDGGGGEWGTITGTLSAQTDLQAALNNKAALSHTHTKANITDFAHTHVKANITDFAHTHVRADITDFAHTHLWADITDKPLTFAPSAHTHTKANITDFAHTHLWADITDKPSTFTPSTHTHLWADITDKPVTFAPSAHSHAWGTITGTLSSQTDLQTALNAKAETLHTHTAANITSGVLALAQGGTGVVTTPTNGQLLIGNGGGYTLSTITAGTGITVTNGVGAITIASTITPGSAVWGSITGTLSSQTDLQTALNGKANTSHNHAATEITSGLLPIARGGTNIGTTPTNGQLLIGNGTGYAVANITAGSGVTVTNGAGTITIAATASGSPFTTFGNTSYVAPGSNVGGTISGGAVSGNYFFSPSNAYTVNVSNAGRSFTNNFIHIIGSSSSATATFNGSLIDGNFIAASGAITLNSNNNNNEVNRNSILSSQGCNLYANNSGVQRSTQYNSLIACSNTNIGAVSPSASEQVVSTLIANSTEVILENTVRSFYANLARIRIRGGTNNYISMFNVPGDRVVTLDLNGNTNEAHHHVMSGGISLMPVVSGYTSQIRFYQTIPTANTVVPSPWYFTTLTIDSSALTSNVTFQLPSSNGSSGQFLTTNGSGVTSWANVSLTQVTLSQNTASPNNTVNATRILANAASTNADLVLQPKGTGALLAQLPDSTATGGNKRGDYAVDLQMIRNSASQVASGSRSLTAGQGNTASGAAASAIGLLNVSSGLNSVALGAGNESSAYSSVSLGNYGKAYIDGQVSFGVAAQASPSTTGLCQSSIVTLCANTTSATPTLMKAADTFSAFMQINPVVNSNCAIHFIAKIIGRSSGGDVATFMRDGVIKNISGATSLVGSIGTIGTDRSDAGLSSCTVAITANNTTDRLDVEITGVSSTTIRWTCTLIYTEVTL